MPNNPAEHDTPVGRNGSDLIELEQRTVRWWQPLAVLLVLVPGNFGVRAPFVVCEVLP